MPLGLINVAALRHYLHPQKTPQIHSKKCKKWSRDARLVYKTSESIQESL